MSVYMECGSGCLIEVNGESEVPDVYCHAHDREMILAPGRENE